MSKFIRYSKLSQIITGSPNKIREDGTRFKPYVESLEKHIAVCAEILKARIANINSKAISSNEFEAKNKEFRKEILVDMWKNYFSEEEKEIIKTLIDGKAN